MPAQKPDLPVFAPGERKSLKLTFEEQDGKVVISLASRGMDDDINIEALFLAFALEKIIDV